MNASVIGNCRATKWMEEERLGGISTGKVGMIHSGLASQVMPKKGPTRGMQLRPKCCPRSRVTQQKKIFLYSMQQLFPL